MLFRVGKVTVSKAVLDCAEIMPADLIESFDRYIRGDWGQVSTEKHLANDIALTTGGKVDGVYTAETGATFIMSTQVEQTRVVLPSECDDTLLTEVAVPAV